MFDINSFIVDETKRVIGRNPDIGELYFLIGQVEDPSLQCDAEETIKNDAKGTPLARWAHGKTAEFSGSNALMDFNLMSYQLNGEGKTVATSSNPVNAPSIEEKKLKASELTSYVLKYPAVNIGTTDAPAYKITVCTLTKDGAVDKKFTCGQATAAGVFTYTASTHTITFAENDLHEGDRLYVQYEYSTENCVVIYNSAEKFAKPMEIIVEVVGHDVCSPSTAYSGYVVFSNATLSPSTTIAFGREDSFDFSFSATQNYCSDERELFRIVVPQPEQ